MRQLIIAAVTLIVLTAASSALALRSQSQSQSQSVAHCSALVASPPCLNQGVPLQL
jgi:hypothetical protein